MKQNSNYRKLSSLLKSIIHFVTKDLIKTIMVLVSFVIFFLIFYYSRDAGDVKRIRVEDFTAGQPSPSDLVVTRDLTYTDEKATRLKREAEALLVLPVFSMEKQISIRAMEQFDTFKLNFQVLNRQSSSVENTFLKLQSILPGYLSREDVKLLQESDDIQEILVFGENLLNEFYEKGIFSLPSGDRPYQSGVEILIDGEEPGEIIMVPTGDIITRDDLERVLSERTADGEFPEEWIDPLMVILNVFLQENTFYNSEATELKRQEAESRVEPVTGLLVEGERILQKGVIVTAEDLEKIRVLGNHTMTLSSYSLFGAFFYLFVLFILTMIFLSPAFTRVSIKRTQIMIIAGALFLYSILGMVAIRFWDIPASYPMSIVLPSAMISIILTILINSRVGFFITVVFSLGLLLQTRMEPYSFIFALFTGLIGAVTVSTSDKKGYLIRSTGILAFSGGFILLVIGLLKGLSLRLLLSCFGYGFLNGLACGILAIGLLPFMEHLLNAATPSRLMELSDLNSPLFKRMLVLAPGTYGHSISVANLAESAARAIGANALLARVGAYYHDIGKIDQAEYFAENQTVGNKHDELKPTLSTTVIKTHVKIGVEKGKELGLPREVIDIIDQHHGSGLISYFYIQAMKEQKGKVQPEDFSYNGIPPQSREAAVVMLADSVEAASRTLVKPNVSKLEKFTWEIIMDKVENQQMRGCDLSFRDMETIKKTFVQILAGHFHTRIEYPDMKNSGAVKEKSKK